MSRALEARLKKLPTGNVADCTDTDDGMISHLSAKSTRNSSPILSQLQSRENAARARSANRGRMCADSPQARSKGPEAHAGQANEGGWNRRGTHGPEAREAAYGITMQKFGAARWYRQSCVNVRPRCF